MEIVNAYKAERSGRLHQTEQGARRDEFEWLMQDAGGHLPSFNPAKVGSNEELMDWLAGVLNSGAYNSALAAFRKALDYFTAHYEVITGKSPARGTGLGTDDAGD